MQKNYFFLFSFITIYLNLSYKINPLYSAFASLYSNPEPLSISIALVKHINKYYEFILNIKI